MTKHSLAKTYGWTLEYIDGLSWDELSCLGAAQQWESEQVEKEQRKVERESKKRRR